MFRIVEADIRVVVRSLYGDKFSSPEENEGRVGDSCLPRVRYRSD